MAARSGGSVATHRSKRAAWHGPVTVVSVILVAALVATGVILFQRTSGSSCSGDVTVTKVAASSTHFGVLDQLAKRWTEDAPSVEGQCVGVTVVEKGSSEVAATLGPAWDEARDGPRPDVWMPDSRLWMLIASTRPDTAAILPSTAPSIASSQVVLALRRPVAQALGWPQNPQLGWDEVLGSFARPDVWAAVKHPEYAKLKMGMVDATSSTAGLASTLALLDRDADSKLSNQEITTGVAFTQLVGGLAPDPAVFLEDQTDPNSPVAVFPILERDLAVYAAKNPAAPMVPIYAPVAPIVADFPYAVLNASWVDPVRRETARRFQQYLESQQGADALAADGFRDPLQGIRDSAKLPADLGFKSEIAQGRPLPSAVALSQLITDWTSLQRQSNILAVLDTSGSMNQIVPGTRQTRLQLLQQTALAGFALLNAESKMGLWQFSANLTRNSHHRELVPYGPLADNVGPVPRPQALAGAVQGLRAAGGTALYDTAYAAFRAMKDKWEPNDTNAVLLITDGKNEIDGGLSLQQLLSRLAEEVRPDQPIPIISIAVGPEADANALRQISQATGGRTFVARDPNQAVQTLVLAFAGRLA
jgi:Ca-activated chloride channel homolog